MKGLFKYLLVFSILTGLVLGTFQYSEAKNNSHIGQNHYKRQSGNPEKRHFETALSCTLHELDLNVVLETEETNEKTTETQFSCFSKFDTHVSAKQKAPTGLASKNSFRTKGKHSLNTLYCIYRI